MNTPLDTLWYTRCPVPTGLGIAMQRGWLEASFAARHTVVKSLRESDDQAVRESHFDHTLRNSVRHGGSIPAIWARAAGRDTRVIGLSWADETQLILTRPDTRIRTVRDLVGRRFGLPNWRNVQIDFTRAQALRGIDNALSTEGRSAADVERIDFDIGGTYSDAPGRTGQGPLEFGGVPRAQHPELLGLLRGDVDAIFLKGAHAAQLASQLGLVTVIDIGAHPEPLLRVNNGTPRTLSVDAHLLDRHFDAATQIVEQVLLAEQWAHAHPDDTRRFLAWETNSSEHWVRVAYGDDAHLRLRTGFDPIAARALTEFSAFLHRWGFIAQPVDVPAWLDAHAFDAARERVAARAA
ncbi:MULTISPECIES: ABC transporter substrate-binding protein [Burkholderia cepacia complex]|uniref:ABC transporter substrate-binding protein n=1 Tax=Burkholderia cepacia complex TaxID=87882 RepID=UPI000F08EBE9|nr:MULTISPECIES: ABC transporter substrate-binding protein [Burkholderia cepacia complex]AYQ43642.1 ABC transporter substrate-binding protein [Burkholderia lata]